MTQEYGLKVSRLEGLTDGIFAIAMTILVLDLQLPRGLILPQNLANELREEIFLKLFVYVGSFIILGTCWVAMQFQMSALERVNRTYLWTHVFYLMGVCVVPFSASLMAEYPDTAVSIYFFACNLLFISLNQYVIYCCSLFYGLNKPFYTGEVRYAIVRRIFVAPVFYVAALVLAQWNTHIAFILLIVPTLIYVKPGLIDKLAASK